MASPAAMRRFGSVSTLPFIETWPALISALWRLRDSSGARRAKNPSSRRPASSGSTRKAAFSMGSAMAGYDPEDEEPLDPAAERLRRKMARLVLVSGGIMMLGLIAVFAAIVYKLGVLGPDGASRGAGASFAAGTVEAAIRLPVGARLVAADLDGDRALLTIEAEGGSALLLVDLRNGGVLGRYALAPE